MTIKEFRKKNTCGKLIGKGIYRDVYELKGNKNWVVKIDRDPTTAQFPNVAEWNNWCQNSKWGELSKWLAPCEAINQTGQVLIQRRVKQKEKGKYPKKIPNLFTDTKYANAGWIGKQFVFCDYPVFVQTSLKLKKAKWWGENDLNFTRI